MEVVSGVRIVQCHAIIDVVINIRVMECHASMDVVIGVRVDLANSTMNSVPMVDFFELLLLSVSIAAKWTILV